MQLCERDWYIFWEDDMSAMHLGFDVIMLGLNIYCVWKTDEVEGIWNRLKKTLPEQYHFKNWNYRTLTLIL